MSTDETVINFPSNAIRFNSENQCVWVMHDLTNSFRNKDIDYFDQWCRSNKGTHNNLASNTITK